MKKRTLARLTATQAVFQLAKSEDSARSIIGQFLTHRVGKDEESLEQGDLDRTYFTTLVEGVETHLDQLNEMISESLADGWTVDRLDSVALAVLRCGTYELLFQSETPPKTVINEYLDIAHSFDIEDTSFINKILDKLAHLLRPDEI